MRMRGLSTTYSFAPHGMYCASWPAHGARQTGAEAAVSDHVQHLTHALFKLAAGSGQSSNLTAQLQSIQPARKQRGVYQYMLCMAAGVRGEAGAEAAVAQRMLHKHIFIF